MWAEGGVTTEGEEVGTAEVEASVIEEAVMALEASVLSFAMSAVAEVAESVTVVGGGSVMFTSLAAADGEV
jgi:hypothetical protein